MNRILAEKSKKMSVLDILKGHTGRQIEFGIRISHKTVYYLYTKSNHLPMTDFSNFLYFRSRINKNESSKGLSSGAKFNFQPETILKNYGIIYKII